MSSEFGINQTGEKLRSEREAGGASLWGEFESNVVPFFPLLQQQSSVRAEIPIARDFFEKAGFENLVAAAMWGTGDGESQVFKVDIARVEDLKYFSIRIENPDSRVALFTQKGNLINCFGTSIASLGPEEREGEDLESMELYQGEPEEDSPLVINARNCLNMYSTSWQDWDSPKIDWDLRNAMPPLKLAEIIAKSATFSQSDAVFEEKELARV